VRRKGWLYCYHVDGEALCNHEVATAAHLSIHFKSGHLPRSANTDEDEITAANYAVRAQREPKRFCCDVPDSETKVVCNTSTVDQSSADRNYNGVPFQQNITCGIGRVYAQSPGLIVTCRYYCKKSETMAGDKHR